MDELEKTGHVRKPTQMDIDPKDQLVYLYIRSFLNNETKLCNPGIGAIQKRFGISKDKIQESIQHLKESGWIETEPKGRGVNYIFKKDIEHYERFSNKFLENRDMSLTKKSILVALQDYMWRDDGELGKITFSDFELADKLHMPYSTLKRNLKELEDDKITFTVPSKVYGEGGCVKKIRFFNLYDYCQAVAFTLTQQQMHLNRLSEEQQELSEQQTKTKEDVKELQDKMESMQKTIELLSREIMKNNKEPQIVME